jgi:type I restriction enzyme R subunit
VFDARLIGLTATPSKQTLGFFNQNLVMDYNHERAVADGVNVNYDVHRIRTAITEGGSTIESGLLSTNATAARARCAGNSSMRPDL